MRYAIRLTLSASFLFLCACATFESKQQTPPQEVPKKILAVPVSKNWQLIEEAPVLTNERNDYLPFQTERSVQPAGAQPTSPVEKRKIETPR
jgi:hypothetical protein